MSGELVTVIDDAAAAVELAELEEQARAFAHDSRAASTWRAYERDFADFRAWCASGSRRSSRCRRRRRRWLSTSRRSPPGAEAIDDPAPTGLDQRGAPSGGLRDADDRCRSARGVVGIRRRHGTAPRKVRAARTKVITAMVAPLGDGLADVRDRTLLLFGFAGALRRSELVALDVEDVSEDDGGLRLILRRSKTDQEAEGTTRGLPYGSHPATCPVRAWRSWLAASGIDTGPAFRSVSRHGHLGTKRLTDRAVANMIKRRASPPGSTARSPVTPCGPASPPRATPRAHPNSPSCATGAGGPPR